MAQKRMFSKTITNSSRFLMMPPTAQLLYVHLCMNADDDGFCEHFPVMRMVEAKPDDLKILAAREFVSVFDDRVLIITDWKENNYIRVDRYTPSKYLALYKDEIKRLSSGIPAVDQMATQVRLDKVSIGNTNPSADESAGDVNAFIELFSLINPSYSILYPRKPQRNAAGRLLKMHPLDYWKRFMAGYQKALEDRYCPKATTPIKLEEKLAEIEAYGRQRKSENSVPYSKKY